MNQTMTRCFQEVEKSYPKFFKGDFKFMQDSERHLLHRQILGDHVPQYMKDHLRLKDSEQLIELFDWYRDSTKAVDWAKLAMRIEERKQKEGIFHTW